MKEEMKAKEDRLSFYDHIEELRERLIKCVLAVLLFSLLAYQFKARILSFLIKPVKQLIFTSPADAFVVQLTLAIFVGFLLSLPIIFYQMWQFVASALKEEEKKFIYAFGPVSLALFICGAVFAYYLFVPFALKFMLSFANEMLIPMITVKSYFSFVATMVLAFGIIFEFPLVILFLTKIGIATPAFLAQKRKYAVVTFFIIGALITPPDLITQWLLAIPLMVLYEASILVSKMVYKDNIVVES